DLLAYMWQISPTRGWILGLLGAAVGMLVCGAALLSPGPPEPGAKRGVVMQAAAGSALAAAGLALLYPGLVPPLQAADEPTHLLNYAQVTGSKRVPGETERWAAAAHFERIRFHDMERFRPSDRGRPMKVAWTGMEDLPYEPQRSSAMLKAWPL